MTDRREPATAPTQPTGPDIDVNQVAWAVQDHQDRHAPEGKHPRWHCGGSDCGMEIGRLLVTRLTADRETAEGGPMTATYECPTCFGAGAVGWNPAAVTDREAQDQRLRALLAEGFASAGPSGSLNLDHRWWRDKARAALATEGEPTAPRETPLKCRWCGQTDWLTTEDIVAAYRAYGRAPAPTAPEPRETLDVERLARALQSSDHGTAYHDRQGRRVDWRYLNAQERAMKIADAQAIAAAYRAAPESREAGT